MYKILSIEGGGGIRGLISAAILSEIEMAIQKPISKIFDMIAGTSIGGILALSISKPKHKNGNEPEYTMEAMLNMYAQDLKKIFHSSIFENIHSGFGLLDNKYSSEGIESVLKSIFLDFRLSDALNDLLVPSFDIELYEPYFFDSVKAKIAPNADEDYLMWEVARATSAAPTYFDPYRLKTDEYYNYKVLIDGGVCANNPALSAFFNTRDRKIDDVFILTLCADDKNPRYEYSKIKDWGMFEWNLPIISTLVYGYNEVSLQHLKKLLPEDKLIVINPIFEGLNNQLDNTCDFDVHLAMIEARRVIDKMKDSGEFERLCKILV